MKAANLHDLWSSPDNTRLTSKQFSFRLPTHVAARIVALCEMYPTKNRTHVVADLLAAALEELERAMPQGLGLLEPDQEPHRWIAEHGGYQYEPVHRIGGPRGQFRDLANKHFEEIEKELGNENPEPLYLEVLITASELKDQ